MNAVRKSLFVTVLAFVLPACMGSPHDGQWFNKKTDSIPFAGLVRLPGDVIMIQAYGRELPGINRAAGWDFVAQTNADLTPTHTEPNGDKWYGWQINVPITISGTPDLRYWTSMGESGWRARVRAVGWNAGELIGFRANVKQCLNGNKPLACGGAKITTAADAVNSCSANKKEVTIYAVD